MRGHEASGDTVEAGPSVLTLRQRLQAVPKAELHLHLRGAVPPAVFAELFNRCPPREALLDVPKRHLALFEQCANIRPFLSVGRISADQALSLFRYGDFNEFLATYCFTSYFVRDAADLRMLIAGVLEALRAQNVVYAEITLSVVEYLWQGLRLAEIADCLDEAACAHGVRVQWIVDLVRDIGPEAAHDLLRQIVGLRSKAIVGITLGGSEHEFPPDQFAEVYGAARQHGLRLTVHAGEVLGPESVWAALRLLKVERIGHGIRAVEDEALIAYLAGNRIPLEVCPTSNVKTGVVDCYSTHPVKALHEAGVPITISTDDPTFFDTTLTDELACLRDLGLREKDVLEVLKNGFRYAFLPEEDVAPFLRAVDRAWGA